MSATPSNMDMGQHTSNIMAKEKDVKERRFNIVGDLGIFIMIPMLFIVEVVITMLLVDLYSTIYINY